MPASVTGSSLEDPSTSYLAITGTKYLGYPGYKEEGLFWLTVSGVSSHGKLSLEHHDGARDRETLHFMAVRKRKIQEGARLPIFPSRT